MARLEFKFVPTASAATGSDLTLEDIPQDIRDDIEEVYAYMKKNPSGRMRTPAFEDKTAALAWQAMATAYCALRPGGPIRFRKSPTKNLPENVFDFRVTDLAPDNGTDGVREAIDAAKNAALTTGTTPPVKGAKK